LLALLRRGARPWTELLDAGFTLTSFGLAVRELKQMGHKILVSPLRVELGDQILPKPRARIKVNTITEAQE
jgi:hypothetical protein